MLIISGLLRFLKSISVPLLTGYFTIFGALIGATAAIIGIWLLLRYHKGKEERDRQDLLKAVYNALKSEIETNKEFFECGISKALKEETGAMYKRSTALFEYNVMYKANAQIICNIEDLELIKAIVKLYGLWDGLTEILKSHSAEVEKHFSLQIAKSLRTEASSKYEFRHIEESIATLTNMIRESYTQTKQQTERVLEKLNAQKTFYDKRL
jgi:gas vesicle protein